MLTFLLMRLTELFFPQSLLLLGTVFHFVFELRLVFLFLFHVRHQLSLELDLGFLLLKLSGSLIVQLILKLLLDLSFLLLSLLALLTDLLLVFFSLIVYDLSPFILWEHGRAIDAQVN
jgi:hypothetical protein